MELGGLVEFDVGGERSRTHAAAASWTAFAASPWVDCLCSINHAVMPSVGCRWRLHSLATALADDCTLLLRFFTPTHLSDPLTHPPTHPPTKWTTPAATPAGECTHSATFIVVGSKKGGYKHYAVRLTTHPEAGKKPNTCECVDFRCAWG